MSNLEITEHGIVGSNLTPGQQRFVNLYVTGQYKNVELARLLDISTTTINNWLNIKEVQTLITEYQAQEHENTKKKLNSLTDSAVNTMMDLLGSPVEAVRLQASKDILDRTGFKQATKMEVKKEVFNYEASLSQLLDIVDEEDVAELAEGLYLDGEVEIIDED